MPFGSLPSLYDITLWIVAGAMAIATSFLLKWTVKAREKQSPLGLPLIVFILVMMFAMVASAVVYFLNPSTGLLLDLIIINMLVMTGGILPILLMISMKFSETEEELPLFETTSEVQEVTSNDQPQVHSLEIPVVVTLVLLNEFFMGWALLLASGVGPSSIDMADPAGLLSSVVNSYWFIFTMSTEMALTTYFLRNEIGRTILYVVAFQSVIMFLSPTAVSDFGWIEFAVYGGSAAMIVLFIYVFEFMARNSVINNNLAQYLLRLLTIYSLMMAGLFFWALYHTGILFSFSIILEMIAYFYLVLNHKVDLTKKSWLLDAKWTLGVVSLIFVAEFFMGGLLDVQVNGAPRFLAELTLAPLTGNGIEIAGAAVYNFLIWFGTVTDSVWFLLMMGIEMGALVAFKIRTARELETKIRLALVIVAYAVYTILLPYFIIPNSSLPTVSFLGWSMGVGTSGPVAPALLVAIAGTYIVSGILSLMFGSRQLCSMFCTAALMYQGTFYDKMKTFNRSSKFARKFLSTRLSNLYRTIFSMVWVSVFAAILLSYLDSIGVIRLTIFGYDPAMFLYLFYFDFLWYVVFITIPFVGTYACVNMGWCHWGTFNQLVSRLGFFKLKVKSTDTCVHCPTKDCASACPVGLTDLPRQFISKGELKSHKCIGVGDCVTSCPYENIQFHDVRHWVKSKVSKPMAIDSGKSLIRLKRNIEEFQKSSNEATRVSNELNDL